MLVGTSTGTGTFNLFGRHMASSRTVKTLGALLIAMTLGALALMVLETEPIRPLAQPLAVVQPLPAGVGHLVYETTSELRPARWQHVVVHASPRADTPLARGCHFLVTADGGGRVVATDLWRSQRPGGHIGGYWRKAGIGVCLIGDFSRRGPAGEQFESAVDLVNTLQETCRIPADRVYLQQDIVPGSGNPGRAFPARRFSARLLRPQR